MSGQIGTKQVTIFGASGFVGRYIVRRMAQNGWRIKAATRRPNEAGFLRTTSSIGQVEPVFANIRDEASSYRAIEGSDAVVNCVSTFDMRGKNSFEAINIEAAARLARLTHESGVDKFIHISSISANAKSKSRYATTKAEGEAQILKIMPAAYILRPTIIFGTEDRFFNRFGAMARFGPFLPIIGGDSLFQPVYVDDVAAACEYALTQTPLPGIYELGGPDIMNFRELMQVMLEIIRRQRIIINMPFPLARLVAKSLNVMEYASFGVMKNTLLTPDQVILLAENTLVKARKNTLSSLGVRHPTSLHSQLEAYLWCYRPGGQYCAINESAENLRS